MMPVDRRLAMLKGGTLGLAAGLVLLTVLQVMAVEMPPVLAVLPLGTSLAGVLIGRWRAGRE